MLIDSHCHLHDKDFFTAEEAEKCIARANKAGVEKIVCIGTDHEDSLAARDFAAKHDNIYWTYGIHPENATGRVLSEPIFSDAGLEFSSTSYTGQPAEPSLRDEPVGDVRNRRVENSNHFMHPRKTGSATRPVAIGEVGLDYHCDGYDRDAQIKLFEQMLQLAQDNDLPVSFHVREAFADFFPLVENFPNTRGVVHSFTDSKKVLKRIINETDFYVGVNGLATYTTLATPPLERILLETDAPFLAPIPHRGEGNEPAYIADIAGWLAEKLGTSTDEVAKITTSNCNNLFKW
ncbi:TatD family hydrolase [Candidatus Saccharibacteria bacterium]|nr:TatD family hydrolase [Candidatus Saccharibacteria bacterium]